MSEQINYDYLARIRSAVAIYTKRRTSNILDGGFRAVVRGKSMEFDDLKEYVPGDDIRDIDWRSSSRSGKVLIRRYVAERRHNLLFVCGTGPGMTGDSEAGERKSHLLLQTFGTVAYLADRQGADFAVACADSLGTRLGMFRSGTDALEEELRKLEKRVEEKPKETIDHVLQRAVDLIQRRMIIILITDLDGLSMLREPLIRRVTMRNDLLVFTLTDAWFYGADVYDVDGGCYENDFILGSRKLLAAEKAERSRIRNGAERIFRKYGVAAAEVSRESEIIDRTVEIFARERGRKGGTA
jgi:uncharacterized protein (DUF58 family)